MTPNSGTKQSIASSIASLALNPAETLGNNIAKMMDTPSTSSLVTSKKGQISASLDQYEDNLIAQRQP